MKQPVRGIAAAALSPLASHAQTVAVPVSGLVTDASGAVIPNATVGSGAFGRVTSQANSPRQTQLALKILS